MLLRRPISPPIAIINIARRYVQSKSPTVAVNAQSDKSKIQKELAAYRTKVSETRKKYFAETLAIQNAAKKNERARKAEIKAEEEVIMSDPLLVGTYKPRRELKRERQQLFGKFAPIPVNVAQPMPPAMKFPSRRSKTEPIDPLVHLRQVYARDLTPNNPRLMHLLYLWNCTEKFITSSNLDEKIEDFFNSSKKNESMSPVADALHYLGADQVHPDEESAFTTRVHNLMEFGVSESNVPNLSHFDLSQFATEDKDTAPDINTQKLTGGSLYEHALTRDLALRDKLSQSFFGRPNVEKVLEWGKTVTDPVQAVHSKTDGKDIPSNTS